jgi:hypothetical protein
MKRYEYMGAACGSSPVLAVLILACWVQVGVSEETQQISQVSNRFDLRPEMHVAMSPTGSLGLNEMVATLPLPPTAGCSFVGDFDLTLETFNHYAPLKVGFANADCSVAALISFYRHDDGISKAHFELLSSGAPVQSAVLQYVDTTATYHIRFEYSNALQSFRAAMRNAKKESVLVTDWLAFSAPFDVRSFFIEGADRNDMGLVWFDPDANHIYVRSYMASEGSYNYLYMVEATLDNLVLRYLPERGGEL